MNTNYNLFFCATLCHVCKRFSEDVCLKRCAACKMIAYCSQQHQKQHWPQHKHLCRAISDVLKNYKMEICNSKEEWSTTRLNFMLLVTLKLTRRLEVYEEEMFKFPRVCLVCYEENGQLLQDCQNCRAVSFCANHKDSFVHKDTCYLFKLCLDLDTLAMDFEHESSLNYLQYVVNKTIKDFSHMDDFIGSCTQSYFKRSDMLKALQSEHLTRPLTLLYGMRMLDYAWKHENLVIHVIAAASVELATLKAWEVLLHLVPAVIASVKIVMIGPKLSEATSVLSDTFSNCASQGKKLLFEYHSTLYADYLSSSAFAKADLVVGFNAGIHAEEIGSPEETWAPSICALAKQNYPLILSCYTQNEMELEITRINDILGGTVDYIYHGKNPFSSLRPYRDWSEDLFYNNNYIIIYRNLCVHDK